MPDQPKHQRSGWRKFWFTINLIQVRLRFIMLLAATGFVIGYWDHVENWWEKKHRPETSQAQAESEWEYFCPMHPFIVRSTTDKCPICGMPLSQRKKGEAVELPEGTLSRVQVSPERVTQAGVKVVDVDYELLHREIRAVGAVDYNEKKIGRVTARFPGRIEKVFVNYEGARVEEGDPLVQLYSPKYLAATHEFVQALEYVKRVAPGSSPDERRRAQNLVEMARQRLLLAGFEPEQVEEIEETGEANDRITYYSKTSGIVVDRVALPGEYVNEGTLLYTVADISNVWVQLEIPESEVSAAQHGTAVELTVAAYPGKTYYGNIDFVSPELDPRTRSVRVRVQVDNRNRQLLPGMFASAVLRAPLGRFEQIEASPEELARVNAEALAASAPGAGSNHESMSNARADEADTSMTAAFEGILAQSSEAIPTTDTEDAEKWVEGYTCPMHPEILSETAEICKACDCGMMLTKWRIEKVLAIPELAVIDTGLHKIVYVEQAPGVYDARDVKLGPRAGEFYPVIDGLRRYDRVVAAGSFLIDAENRLSGGYKFEKKEATADKSENPTVIVRGTYQPETLKISANQRQIVFDRREDSACSEEIVFPTLGIRQQLPAFKKTIIDLPTTATGEIPYACGMDMMKGTIIIEDTPPAGEEPPPVQVGDSHTTH